MEEDGNWIHLAEGFVIGYLVEHANDHLKKQESNNRRAMAMEAYTSKYPDKIHTEVLYDARQTCYKARDAFYACLEKQSHIKANEIAAVGLLYPVECKKTRDFYEKVCRRTWVKHFDRQYCTKKRALQTLLDDNESRRAAGVYV